MALNVKNSRADQLARELAEKTGLTITDAVIAALEEKLERETGRADPLSLADELLNIGKRCAALANRDNRTADEILGYNEIGVPE